MKKKLTLFDLISLGVGTIIGAGVFSVMGYGIAYTGRGIVAALFLAMFLVVMQGVRYPIITKVFGLDGGMYAVNSLTNPKVMSGFSAASDVVFKVGSSAVTVISIVQYLIVLFPGVANYQKLVGVAILTVAYLCGVAGDKFSARIQNVMVLCLYAALGLFVVYGFAHISPSAYAGEPAFPNGITGLMMATALMSYTCNGFQYVINVGKGAENPKRDIPLAFFLSALIAACIYALIGFSATHVASYADIAGKNLGDIAKLIMPSAFYTFFVVGGAIFALSTSLLGGIVSGYRPVQAAARDGWFPAILGKESKRGTPYVYALLYALNLIPLILGLDLSNLVTMSLIPSGIVIIITNLYAMKVPDKYSEEWKASGIKLSAGGYKVLMILSIIASAILVAYCFLSNDMKVATVIVTIAILTYGYLRNKFGHIEIQAQKAASWSENKE